MVEGENRTLTCNISGSPVQTVTWTKVRSSNQSKGVSVILQTSAGIMLVNTNVKLQMTVEIALPALSSLCSVSDHYSFNDDRVKNLVNLSEFASFWSLLFF